MLITLIFFAGRSNASNADIGYKDGLSISSALNVYKWLYVQASNDTNESYGAGFGYKTNSFNFKLMVNNYEFGQGLEFNAQYYDLGVSYFFSVGNNYIDEESKYSYLVGAGYPVKENVSLIAHYSNKQIFLGIRKWF